MAGPDSGSGSMNTRQTSALTCQLIKDRLPNEKFLNLLDSAVSKTMNKKMSEIIDRLDKMVGSIHDLQTDMDKNKIK